jgi:hypothetical protein
VNGDKKGKTNKHTKNLTKESLPKTRDGVLS